MFYLSAVLLLAGGSLFFYELFLSVGRNSFFTFRSDYIACFMPWNESSMYPGQPFHLMDLITNFFEQFYYRWIVIPFTIVAGLLFSLLLTYGSKRLLRLVVKDGKYRQSIFFVFPLFWAFVFLCCQVSVAYSKQPGLGIYHYKIDKILRKTERLVEECRYEEALQFANKYWYSNPCSINDVITGRNSLYADISKEETFFRQELAAYTRIALLGAHRLSEDFFKYYRVPEIYGQLDEIETPFAVKCSVFRGRLLGNHTVAYGQIMNLVEYEGLSYFLLDQSIYSALVCFQYQFAAKYIRLLKQTLFYHKRAELYEEVSCILQDTTANKVSFSMAAIQLATEMQQERRKILTEYMHLAGIRELEFRELWRQSPYSLENLEYISLLDLLYKRNDSVMVHIGDYLRLSNQGCPPYRLPSSWQEMLLVEMEEHGGQLPDMVENYVQNLIWDKTLLVQNRMFYQERDRLKRGESSPEQITQKFGHTFAYNYYYSRFVTPRHQGGKHTMIH